jgi:hypothetical protein
LALRRTSVTTSAMVLADATASWQGLTFENANAGEKLSRL